MAGACEALDRLVAAEGKNTGRGGGYDGVLRESAAVSRECGTSGRCYGDDVTGSNGAVTRNGEGATIDTCGAGVGVLAREGYRAAGGLVEANGACEVGGGVAATNIEGGEGSENAFSGGPGAGDRAGLERDAVNCVGVGAEGEGAAVDYHIGGVI